MEICTFNLMNPHNTVIKHIFGYRYVPRIRFLRVINREYSSFMYIKRGVFRYNLKNGEFSAKSGDLVYIPCGSCHEYSVISKDTECIQLEFEAINCESGKRIICSETPVICAYNIPLSLEDTLMDIIQGCNIDRTDKRFKVIADVFEIFAFVTENSQATMSKNRLKLLPAIDYIDRNYNEKFYISKLAELCFLSESQFRRIFSSEMNMTPVQYKNIKCINMACKMLRSGMKSISDTANALGFDNIYSFSSIFKRYTGIAPSYYADGEDIKEGSLYNEIHK